MKKKYIEPTVKSMSLAEDTYILASLSIDTNKDPGNGNGNTNWGSKEHTFREEEWSDEEWGEI